jgi:hypothetical protein
MWACTKTRNNRNETTGTKQLERPEQESEMTGTTGTKIEHDRNNVVDHARNDSYLGLTIVPVVFYYIVPIVFDFGSGGSGCSGGFVPVVSFRLFQVLVHAIHVMLVSTLQKQKLLMCEISQMILYWTIKAKTQTKN